MNEPLRVKGTTQSLAHDYSLVMIALVTYVTLRAKEEWLVPFPQLRNTTLWHTDIKETVVKRLLSKLNPGSVVAPEITTTHGLAMQTHNMRCEYSSQKLVLYVCVFWSVCVEIVLFLHYLLTVFSPFLLGSQATYTEISSFAKESKNTLANKTSMQMFTAALSRCGNNPNTHQCVQMGEQIVV